MKKLTITINTENAAFDDNEYELSEILKNLSRRMQIKFFNDDCDYIYIKDTNGNTVGNVEIE